MKAIFFFDAHFQNSLINLPKFASINKIFWKFDYFMEFSAFFLANVATLDFFMGFSKNVTNM